MERNERKTKRALNALIVIGALLIVALIAGLVYYYLLKDDEEDQRLSQITCGCYMIDPAVVNECGDPRRAFLFNLNTVSADQTCSAKCDINDVADNLLNSLTPKEAYKSCTVRSIADTRCENMILKDQDDKIVTGRVQPTDQLTVEATFDKSTYTDYTFKINNTDETPDRVDGNKAVKTITDLNNISSVEIVATAKSEQGEQINSIVCRRLVEVETTTTGIVTGMTALTEQQADGKTKISQVLISVGQIESGNVKVRFSFSSGFASLNAIDGITVESARGGISMSKLDLYDDVNFTQNSFNILNNHLGELEITAEVFVNDQSIGSTSTKVTFRDTSATEDPQEPVQPGEAAYSNFSVSKTTAQSCVERTSPSNVTTFTLAITNNRTQESTNTTPDEIEFVKDKLPLGFVYTANSTSINGASSQDSGLVTVTNVGGSQEIVWKPTSSWVVDQNDTLTITFDSSVTSSSVTGQHLNEVVVNPIEVPLNPNTLRSQVAIIVAQDCGNITEEEKEDVPTTGIFDSFGVRIGFGILILVTGWLIYIRPEGNVLSEVIVRSKAYDNYEMTKYRITNPKKYFEQKIIRKKPKANR